MADFSLDDLIQPVTRAEVQQSIYDVLGIVGVNTTSWKSGSPLRTVIVGVSAVLASLSDLQAKIARSGFLDYSSGSWLDICGRLVYGVERIGATFATGTITLINGGGGLYSYGADDLIFRNPTTNTTYRNTVPVTIPPLTTVAVEAAATEAGAESTAEVGEISEMVTVALGVTCTNALPLTGTDAEDDAAYRARCREVLGPLSPNGPWDAYTFVAKSATRPDGSNVGVTRTRITKDGYGNVYVYVAGVSGPIPGDAEDIATDLGIVHDKIQRLSTPLSVTGHTISAVSHAIYVTVEVWIYNTSGLTEDEIKEAIEDAIDAFLNSRPIGGDVIGTDPGKVFVSGLNSAVFDARQEIFRVEITSPATDEVLAENEIPMIGSVTFVGIHQEAPAEGFGGAA